MASYSKSSEKQALLQQSPSNRDTILGVRYNATSPINNTDASRDGSGDGVDLGFDKSEEGKQAASTAVNHSFDSFNSRSLLRSRSCQTTPSISSPHVQINAHPYISDQSNSGTQSERPRSYSSVAVSDNQLPIENRLISKITDDSIITDQSSNGEATKDLDSDSESDSDDDSEESNLTFSSLSRRQKVTICILVLAQFCLDSGYVLIEPFFTEEAKARGASTTEVGFMFSCFDGVMIVTAPFFGHFMRHLGAKFCIVSGLFVSGVVCILMGLLESSPHGLPFVLSCFACRIVQAVGVAAFCTAVCTVICNEFPSRRTTAMGVVETASGMGYTFGPLFGGFLYSMGGFGPPLYFGGGLTLVSAVLLWKLLPHQDDSHDPTVGMSIFHLFTSLQVWVGMITIVMALAGMTFLDPTLQPHLETFGVSTLLVGVAFMIQPGFYALTTPIWGYLCDTRDIGAPLLICGNLVCVLAYNLIGPNPYLTFIPNQLWTILVGVVILGLGTGATLIPAFNFILEGAEELGMEDNTQTFAQISGLFVCSFCLGSAIGPAVAGALVDALDFQHAVLSMMGLYFIGALLCLFFHIYDKLKKRRLKLQKQRQEDC